MTFADDEWQDEYSTASRALAGDNNDFAITRLPASRVLEANQQATELLVNGLPVEGLEGWDGGRGQVLRYIDWEKPTNNVFTVVNQFKVSVLCVLSSLGQAHVL